MQDVVQALGEEAQVRRSLRAADIALGAIAELDGTLSLQVVPLPLVTVLDPDTPTLQAFEQEVASLTSFAGLPVRPPDDPFVLIPNRRFEMTVSLAAPPQRVRVPRTPAPTSALPPALPVEPSEPSAEFVRRMATAPESVESVPVPSVSVPEEPQESPRVPPSVETDGHPLSDAPREPAEQMTQTPTPPQPGQTSRWQYHFLGWSFVFLMTMIGWFFYQKKSSSRNILRSDVSLLLALRIGSVPSPWLTSAIASLLLVKGIERSIHKAKRNAIHYRHLKQAA
jgi:hypothetical protein